MFRGDPQEVLSKEITAVREALIKKSEAAIDINTIDIYRYYTKPI